MTTRIDKRFAALKAEGRAGLVTFLTAGLPIEKKEWFYFAAMIAILMLGTANIRLAAMREQRKLDRSDETSA